MIRRSIACLALAALIPLSDVRAQESLEVGARVRVTAPDVADDAISGTVASVDSASITLAVSRKGVVSERTVPIAAMRRLEISRGRSHSPLKGMGTGLLVGAGIGLGLGVAAATEEGNWVCEGGGCMVYGALGGALWGTVIGGLFGAAIGHEEWDEVTVIHPRVSVRPGAGGVVLAVSLRL